MTREATSAEAADSSRGIDSPPHPHGARASPAAAEPIKVGFNAPLAGFAAADGNSALVGAQLAVEQVNAEGGINGDPIELVVYDDQASPKEAAPLAVKMITQDGVVAGISGSYSGSTRAAATIFQENETPYISAYAVHPEITRAGDYVFRTSFMGEWHRYAVISDDALLAPPEE